MSNREEYNKILQVMGEDGNLRDEEFEKNCAKKYIRARIVAYAVGFAGLFYLVQEGHLFPKNELVRLLILSAVMVCMVMYMGKLAVFKNEIGRYVFRECYPDRGLARYMSFIPMMLHGQLYWSAMQYNIANVLCRLGKIDKANECLRLMQESCTTAGSMLWAEHIKVKIAMYLEDFDTIIACGNEADILYSKVRHSQWNQKVYSDIMTCVAYAGCRKNNDYQGVCQALADPQTRPVDEVARQYYFYRAALMANDYETAEKFKHYVEENAGTTWYGQAVGEGFVPEKKPDNYPGFIASAEKLQKPDKIDKSRLKYLLIGVLIGLLFYLLPRLVF